MKILVFWSGCSSDPPPAPNGTILEYNAILATYTCINTGFGTVMTNSKCNVTTDEWEPVAAIECRTGIKHINT